MHIYEDHTQLHVILYLLSFLFSSHRSLHFIILPHFTLPLISSYLLLTTLNPPPLPPSLPLPPSPSLSGLSWYTLQEGNSPLVAIYFSVTTLMTIGK